jgi:hypothetical protein
MGVQKHYKKRFTKKVVSKSFYKKFDQKPEASSSKPRLFHDFFNHVFGRFSVRVRGVKKHDKKYRKNKSDPSPFLASGPPTHHGGHRFFLLAAPWFSGPRPRRPTLPAAWLLAAALLGAG